MARGAAHHRADGATELRAHRRRPANPNHWAAHHRTAQGQAGGRAEGGQGGRDREWRGQQTRGARAPPPGLPLEASPPEAEQQDNAREKTKGSWSSAEEGQPEHTVAPTGLRAHPEENRQPTQGAAHRSADGANDPQVHRRRPANHRHWAAHHRTEQAARTRAEAGQRPEARRRAGRRKTAPRKGQAGSPAKGGSRAPAEKGAGRRRTGSRKGRGRAQAARGHQHGPPRRANEGPRGPGTPARRRNER
jgi:hypothetical protein